jgi:D-alanyl-D-alanine carboxypeptidase
MAHDLIWGNIPRSFARGDDDESSVLGRLQERRIAMSDRTEPPPEELVTIDPGLTVDQDKENQLDRRAYASYLQMREAAHRDGLPSTLLKVISGFRSMSEQRRLWAKALVKYKTAAEARKWVTPPGFSAHHSGRAVDLWLGQTIGSKQVEALRETRAYKWLVKNASKFGFYPYKAEPWHWEYNPPGLGRAIAAVKTSPGLQAILCMGTVGLGVVIGSKKKPLPERRRRRG